MHVTPRTKHPFHMYDAILAQPRTFAEVVDRVHLIVEQIAPHIATARHIFLVGIGTSFYAAQLGQHFLSYFGVTTPIYAIHSFDFALYGPGLSPDDCVVVISHRGTKQYSLAALKRAHEAGCYTLLITGQDSPTNPHTNITLNTTPSERAFAFTESFTAALAILATLAEAVGERCTGKPAPSQSFLAHELPASLHTCLDREPQIAALASKHVQHRRIWLVGGGPSEIIAQEIAMKIKETSYLQAEGMSTEAIFHGPFQCTEPEDLFLLIAPSGPAQERILPLAAMIKDIGASYLVIGDGTASPIQEKADGYCKTPVLPEPFSALACLLLLQLFCYHLALGSGTNPDGFRLEDQRFAAARKRVQL